MKIEVGKTYLTRDGQRIEIESEALDGTSSVTYRMQGIDEKGRVTWRSRRGRFDRYPSRLDLVEEVTT